MLLGLREQRRKVELRIGARLQLGVLSPVKMPQTGWMMWGRQAAP